MEGTTESWLARGSVALTLVAVVTAVIAGTALALLGFVFPQLSSDAPSDPVPSGVERVVHLPVAATVLEVLALLLAVASVALALRGGRPARPEALRCALLVAGPVLLLLGAGVLAHAAAPCWAGELPHVCDDTPGGGVDLVGRVHPFWTAVFGWVPLGLLYVWALRRWWPEVVPSWVPGADRVDAVR